MTDPASSMASSEIASYDRIRLLWPDHMGLARGKYLPSRFAHHGSGFCVTTFAMSYDRDLIPAPGAALLEGLKDVKGDIDLATLRPSWEDDRTGVAVADLTIHEAPYEVSARTALARAIAEWEALGYSPMVGIELEGYLMEPDGEGGWKRFSNPHSMVYGTGSLGDPTGFNDQVIWAADQCGFALESSHVEFDESQFEYTLRYDSAMKAADDIFLFRTMVREIAVDMGLDFTFLGKPFPDVSGSGMHINFSLLDAKGNPALADEAGEHGMSDLARQCVAGLCVHHNALAAVVAPTANAYRRLQPGTLAGCWANWGVDHRNVTCRIPPEGGSSMRIEHRMPDGAVNVHLGVAAVLQAARLGVVNELDCPPEYTGDGFEDGGGADRCATTLGGALDALEADAAFGEALGELLVANFVANKRHEAEKFDASGASVESEELSDFERQMYLPYH